MSTDDAVLQGLALIRQFEAFRAEAYPDPASGGAPWTYGWGFTTTASGAPVQPGMTISQADADALLLQKFNSYFGPEVDALVRWPKAQDYEIAALYSFAWNEGPAALRRSTLLRLYNTFGPGKRIIDAGNNVSYTGAAGQFGLWVYADGKIDPGLINRRALERDVFLGIAQP